MPKFSLRAASAVLLTLTAEAKDDTFPKAGKVGLWTKADARTSFDDFSAKEVK